MCVHHLPTFRTHIVEVLLPADIDGKFCVVDFNRVSFFCSHHSFWIFCAFVSISRFPKPSQPTARVNVVVKSASCSLFHCHYHQAPMHSSDIPGYPKTVKTGFRAGFLPTRDRPRPDFLKTGKTRKPTSKPRVPGGFEIA